MRGFNVGPQRAPLVSFQPGDFVCSRPRPGAPERTPGNGGHGLSATVRIGACRAHDLMRDTAAARLKQTIPFRMKLAALTENELMDPTGDAMVMFRLNLEMKQSR
jgi:hypothetical protein